MNRRQAFLAPLATFFAFLFGRNTAVAEPPPYTPKVRIWRLGNTEQRVFPTQKAIDRLANILKDWDQVSDLEIIWSDDLSVEQLDLDSNDIDIILPVDAEVRFKDGEGHYPKIRIINRAEP